MTDKSRRVPPDDDAVRIVRNVRSAIDAGGRLPAVETVLPERASTSFRGLLDFEMLDAVVDTAGPMSIVAAPA